MGSLKTPKLISAGIDITNKCNLNCPHCIILPEKRLEGIYLEKDFLKELLSKLLQYGCFDIRVTGGEPLLHPDFSEIYLMFKKMGFRVAIFTNATLLNKELIKFFNLYPPAQLIITLYGAGDEDYKRVAFDKKEGVFTQLKEAITNLTQSKINYKLQCWVFKHAPDLHKRLKASLGDFFDITQAYSMYPRSRTDSSNTKCRLNLDQEKFYQSEVGRKRLAYRLERLMSKSADEKNLLYNCYVKYSIHITADKKLLLCPFHRHKYFDLQRYSLEEILIDKRARLLQEEIPLQSKCYNCEDKNFCKQCVPLGFGAVGDHPFRDDLCRQAKILKKYAQRNKKVAV